MMHLTSAINRYENEMAGRPGRGQPLPLDENADPEDLLAEFDELQQQKINLILTRVAEAQQANFEE